MLDGTRRVAALAIAIILLGGGGAKAQQAAKAEMKNRTGKAVGEVTVTETPNGVLLHAKFDGLPPGVHGFHVHAVGRCDPPFTSAGGHFNPNDSKHGIRVESGPHAGDMPNLHVPDTGRLEIEVLNFRLRFASLFDRDGAAIMVHAGADDYESQPSGAAGNRIACGVIKK